jgi:hypothetical protein
MEMYMDDKSKLLLKGSGEGSLAGRVSSRGAAAAGRLARLVKEQRARFYIMRRCVTMLLCWRD